MKDLDGLLSYLEELKKSDYDLFIESIYNLLEINEEALLKDKTPLESKESALDVMLKYFEKKEEYLKCSKIIYFKNKLKIINSTSEI
jgi:hypothetical protein